MFGEPTACDAWNALCDAPLVRAWAGQPESFTGYVTERGFVTPLGVFLGSVRIVGQWLTPHGKPMRAVAVQNGCGASYYGRYNPGAGRLCRVRRYKETSK